MTDDEKIESIRSHFDGEKIEGLDSYYRLGEVYIGNIHCARSAAGYENPKDLANIVDRKTWVACSRDWISVDLFVVRIDRTAYVGNYRGLPKLDDVMRDIDSITTGKWYRLFDVLWFEVEEDAFTAKMLLT